MSVRSTTETLSGCDESTENVRRSLRHGSAGVQKSTAPSRASPAREPMTPPERSTGAAKAASASPAQMSRGSQRSAMASSHAGRSEDSWTASGAGHATKDATSTTIMTAARALTHGRRLRNVTACSVFMRPPPGLGTDATLARPRVGEASHTVAQPVDAGSGLVRRGETRGHEVALAYLHGQGE